MACNFKGFYGEERTGYNLFALVCAVAVIVVLPVFTVTVSAHVGSFIASQLNNSTCGMCSI